MSKWAKCDTYLQQNIIQSLKEEGNSDPYGVWMNLNSMMLSEIGQSQKGTKYWMIQHACWLKNGGHFFLDGSNQTLLKLGWSLSTALSDLKKQNHAFIWKGELTPMVSPSWEEVPWKQTKTCFLKHFLQKHVGYLELPVPSLMMPGGHHWAWLGNKNFQGYVGLESSSSPI